MAEVVELDAGTFEQIRGLGQDLLEALVADFRRTAPDDLARIGHGLATADADTALRAAHRIKGTCLMLGAARMGALAGDGRAGRVRRCPRPGGRSGRGPGTVVRRPRVRPRSVGRRAGRAGAR